MATAENILLGYGVVSVGAAPIGLTRGGSSFTVEREIRNIEADGDRGPVKGRIVVDTEVAVLTVNALELFDDTKMATYYPAIDITTKKMTSTLAIVAGDHSNVTWVGKTLKGDVVTIEVKNAINMGNIEWSLEDKNEVVPEIAFTATYDEASRNTPPWSVTFAAAA
jgi:hypothetical protein